MHDPELQSHLRNIIYAQCFGLLAMMMVNGPIMLTYLCQLEFTDGQILTIMGLGNIMRVICVMPTSYLCDKYGIKPVAAVGSVLGVLGMLLVSLAGVFPNYMQFMIYAGIIIYSTGAMTFGSGWFALIQPIIPTDIRGRFLSKLRFTWMLISIIFTFVAMLLVKHFESIYTYVGLLLFVTLMHACRWIFYRHIPDLCERSAKDAVRLRESLVSVLTKWDLMTFNGYIFLIHLFTGAAIWMTGLQQREYFGFTDGNIVMMGNMVLVGGLIGYIFSGHLIDKWGTRIIFLCSHLGYGMLLLLFVARDMFPIPLIIWLGVLSMVWGIIGSALSVSMTSELFALLPKRNQSLATGVHTGALMGGFGLSALLAGRLLELKILRETWTIGGYTFNEYDSLLLGAGIMIILLAATVGVATGVRKVSLLPPRR